MPEDAKTPEVIPATPPPAVVTAEQPSKRKGPPPPAPTDQTAATLGEQAKGESMPPGERLDRLTKVLKGMNLSSHETRWLRDSMVILIDVLLEKAHR